MSSKDVPAANVREGARRIIELLDLSQDGLSASDICGQLLIEPAYFAALADRMAAKGILGAEERAGVIRFYLRSSLDVGKMIADALELMDGREVVAAEARILESLAGRPKSFMDNHWRFRAPDPGEQVSWEFVAPSATDVVYGALGFVLEATERGYSLTIDIPTGAYYFEADAPAGRLVVRVNHPDAGSSPAGANRGA